MHLRHLLLSLPLVFMTYCAGSEDGGVERATSQTTPRTPTGLELPTKQEQREGQPTVRFRAFGNEPFWSVDVLADGLALRRLDNEPIEFPRPTIRPSERGEAYSYEATTEAGGLKLMIDPNPCDDTMADTSYTHTTTVTFRPAGGADPVELRGCGGFPPGNPLLGSWTAATLNGEPLSKNPPSIKFMPNGAASGSTGCNYFNGLVETQSDGVLQFGPLAMTKKMCPPENAETAVLTILNSGRVKYELTPTTLLLRARGNRIRYNYAG